MRAGLSELITFYLNAERWGQPRFLEKYSCAAKGKAMTNTIPNVPRELLERVLNAGWGSETVNALDDLRDFLESAPSSAGVDGLKRYEVFPYLDDDVAELDICESDDGTFVKYDDAQAIIDGLRGENQRLQQELRLHQSQIESSGRIADRAQRFAVQLRTERDHLAGLLRDARELITHGVFEDGYCCCGSSVDSHGLGDGHAPVDALSYHAGQVCESIDTALAELPQ